MATMPTTTTPAMTARGKVTAVKDGLVTFVPYNTAYALHLAAPGYAGPMNTLVDGIIRATARKAYTVPSGGNFISPIYGPPKTIQGRVRAVEGNMVVIQAGATIHVELPAEASAVELGQGPISAGSLVNVVAFPGATFELAK